MDRNEFEDRSAAYLGDELDPQARRAFEEHLAACAADRAEVEALQDVVRELRTLPPAPAETADGRRGRRVRPAAQAPGRYRPLAYAAVLLIGVGIGWFAGRSVPSSGRQDARRALVYTPSYDEWRQPSRLIRNARALSDAFTYVPRRSAADAAPNG